jgi:hypothetical protein
VLYNQRMPRSTTRWIVICVLVSSTPAAAECDPAEDFCWSAPSRIGHVLEGGYGIGAGGFTDGTTSAVVVSTQGDVGYRAVLENRDGQPTYAIAAGGGVTLGRMQGTISASQATTRAHLRLGPTPVPASEERGNLAWFPLTFELDHDGEVGAVPRLSARPDASRGVFDRQRVSLATRLVRAEVGETRTTPTTGGPSTTAPVEPISAAIDVLTVFADAETTMQGGTRLEAGIGGALLSITSHYLEQGRADVFALEHRTSWLPDGTTASIATLWMLKATFGKPETGSTYMLGWGVAIGEPYDQLVTPTEDDPHPDLNVGGIGGWWQRRWGGIGFQYERRPYMTMAGEPALDDRAWIEGWRAGKLALTAKGYVARTGRFADGEWLADWSSGLELGARRAVAGVEVAVSFEVGQTYYGELDGDRPELGFAARGGLSLRRSGRRTWTR